MFNQFQNVLNHSIFDSYFLKELQVVKLTTLINLLIIINSLKSHQESITLLISYEASRIKSEACLKIISSFSFMKKSEKVH